MIALNWQLNSALAVCLKCVRISISSHGAYSQNAHQSTELKYVPNTMSAGTPVTILYVGIKHNAFSMFYVGCHACSFRCVYKLVARAFKVIIILFYFSNNLWTDPKNILFEYQVLLNFIFWAFSFQLARCIFWYTRYALLWMYMNFVQ